MGEVVEEHRFRAGLWAWKERPDSWVFLTLPPEVSAAAAEVAADAERRGFGSVRVEGCGCATARWRTSVFPSTEEGAYVLPVKRPVRRAEGLEAGDEAEVVLTLLDR